jgi:hypothetical protein
MGTLDDAIREHLELKRRLGTPEEELQQKETEAFGPPGPLPRAEPPSAEEEPAFQVQRATPEDEAPAVEPDPWEPAGSEDDLFEADEVLPQDALEPNGSYAPPPAAGESGPEEPHEDPLDAWEEEPEPTEDVLRETPEFLEETPEHDRLWFEQKPPKDFDLD